ncbi:transporter substrate-binding domain-containing protein [Labrys neptuniae]
MQGLRERGAASLRKPGERTAELRTSEPWRVGVLFSLTGFMSVVEETQLRGTLMAIDEINSAGGVLGRELVPVIYDPGSEAPMFGHLAKRLIVEDKVSTIFGGYTSSCRKTVVPMLERLDALLWYPTPYEGFEASPNVIYTGPGPNQNILELCRFLFERYGNRFYLVGSNYVYAHAVNRLIRELLRNKGVIAAEKYVDLHARRADFLPIINDIRNLRPDIVFSTLVGTGAIYFHQAYCDAGFDAGQFPIASLTMAEAEVEAMGHDVGEGHITAAPYFQSVATEANQSFVARYKRRFGGDASTNMCAEAAYFQVHLFAKALAQAQTMDTDVLRQAVAGIDFDAPQGNIYLNGSSNHADLWTRIGRVNRGGQFDILSQSYHSVHADPFLTEVEEAGLFARVRS